MCVCVCVCVCVTVGLVCDLRSYNDEGIWKWNTHDSDWIYQGGADPSTKMSYTFNQWGPDGDNLDDSIHRFSNRGGLTAGGNPVCRAARVHACPHA